MITILNFKIIIINNKYKDLLYLHVKNVMIKLF